MGFPGIIAISEVVLGAFMTATWWLVLSRHEVYVGWRRRASLFGLALPAVALAIEIAVSTTAHFYPLRELDEAGGLQAVVALVLGIALIVVGLLSLAGLVSALLGKGNPRIAAVVWSFLVFATFLVNQVLAINSFH
jgi:hypothetical protein